MNHEKLKHLVDMLNEISVGVWEPSRPHATQLRFKPSADTLTLDSISLGGALLFASLDDRFPGLKFYSSYPREEWQTVADYFGLGVWVSAVDLFHPSRYLGSDDVFKVKSRIEFLLTLEQYIPHWETAQDLRSWLTDAGLYIWRN